jgi:hypothetical protein
MATITIEVDGDSKVHIAGDAGNDYATVCGQALDGDQFSGVELPTPRGAKITCVACRNIWNACRGVQLRQFV